MKWFKCWGFIACLLATSALCHADTVIAPFWHLPGSDRKDAYVVDGYWDLRLNLFPDRAPGSLLPGGALALGTPSPSGGSFLNFAFCFDPYVFASGPSQVGTAGQDGYFAHAGTPTLDVQHLYNLYYAQVIASATTPVALGSAEELAAQQFAYEFQVALWELQSDDSNVTSGSLTTLGAAVTNPALLKASAMIAAAKNASGPSKYQFTIWDSPSYQDYIVADPVPVPEPATQGLVLAGLGMLAWSRTRRQSHRPAVAATSGPLWLLPPRDRAAV